MKINTAIYLICLFILPLSLFGQKLIIGYFNPDQEITVQNETVQYDTVIVMNNGTLNIDNSNFTINKGLAVKGTSTLHVQNSTFTVNGTSFFVDQSTITLQDSITFNGHIYIHNRAIVKIDSTVFTMQMRYYYQYYLFLADSAEFNMNNSHFYFGKGKLGGFYSDHSKFKLVNVEFHSPMTSVFNNQTSGLIDNCINPIEFIFHDSCDVEIIDSKGFILWFGFGNGVNANFSFPSPTTLYGATNVSFFRFSGSLAGISGLNYSVQITNTDNVYWCTMQEDGSDVTINNSFLRGCGFNFSKGENRVSEIYDDSLYTSFTANFTNCSISLNNTRVYSWNLYPLDNSKVVVENCVYGELVVYDHAVAVIKNSTCDGLGTKFGVYKNGKAYVHNSLFTRITPIKNAIILNKHSSLTYIYDSEISGDICINDNAKLFLANTIYDTPPAVSDASYLLYTYLDSIAEAFIDSTVLITGTIKDFKGPLNNDIITGYKLEYSNPDSTHYHLIINETDVHIIENDSIYCWSTQDLSEDDYILWLTTYVNGDSAISCSRKISLSAQTMVLERNRQSYCYQLEQNYPNPFNSQTIIQYQLPVQTHVKIKIYDLLGQELRTLIDTRQPVGHHSAVWDGKNNSGQNVSSGIYIYKFVTPEFVRKRKLLLVK